MRPGEPAHHIPHKPKMSLMSQVQEILLLPFWVLRSPMACLSKRRQSLRTAAGIAVSKMGTTAVSYKSFLRAFIILLFLLKLCLSAKRLSRLHVGSARQACGFYKWLF